MSKPTPAVKAKKLPRAIFVVNDWHYCAILPFRSATEAREFVKAANMTEEQRVELVASYIGYVKNYSEPDGPYIQKARAVLRALHFNTGEK